MIILLCVCSVICLLTFFAYLDILSPSLLFLLVFYYLAKSYLDSLDESLDEEEGADEEDGDTQLISGKGKSKDENVTLFVTCHYLNDDCLFVLRMCFLKNVSPCPLTLKCIEKIS